MARPAHTNAVGDSTLSPSGPYRALKQFGLVVLCGAWIVLGLVGHDPWKTEDATAFGVAWGMMQRGDGLAPQLAGEPFVDRPPLVYAAAAGSGHLLSGCCPPTTRRESRPGSCSR